MKYTAGYVLHYMKYCILCAASDPFHRVDRVTSFTPSQGEGQTESVVPVIGSGSLSTSSSV